MGSGKDTQAEDEITIDFSKIKRFFSSDEKEEKTEQSTQEAPKEDEKKEESVEVVKEETSTEKKEGVQESQKEPEPLVEKEPEDHSTQQKLQASADTTSESTEREKKEEDDDISFDLGKIKGMFRSDKTSESSDKNDDIDFSGLKDKATGFFSDGRAKKWGLVILILIPLLLSLYIRFLPASLPVTDDWAEDSVINSYRSQVAAQFRQQFPNLPDDNINGLVDREFETLLKQNQGQIDQAIAQTSASFRDRLQDANGHTYLIAIDPWFWLRHARNIVDHGHPGDTLKDGRWYDDHMYAPNGRFVPSDMFHAYLIAYSYKIASVFSDTTLLRVAFFVPAIIAALAVIPAFLIARRISGNMGGLIAGIIVAIHPAFLTRTVAGFSDTDAYNVFFPLVITWLFIEGLLAKDMKKKLIYIALSSFAVGLFSFAWIGWWYVFDFLLATIILYTAYYVVIHRKEVFAKGLFHEPVVKNALIVFAAFFVITGIFVSIFASFDLFVDSTIAKPLTFTKLKEVGIRTVWPNVYTTVAEQNPASLNSVINQTGIGSRLLFFLSLMGLIFSLRGKSDKEFLMFIGGSAAWYLFILFSAPQNLFAFLLLVTVPVAARILYSMYKKEDLSQIHLATLLSLWFVATLFASTKGIRFTLLLVPAFALLLGVSFGVIYQMLSDYLSKLIKLEALYSKAIVIVLLFAFLLYPVNVIGSGYSTAYHEVPSMNDGWYRSLDKINREAAPDAIINSWWDFGHWFKYIGDRAVTFDGASQNSPPAHWIGKVLSTSDEKLAVGILRMLDCGSNGAYDALVEEVGDVPRTIDYLNMILPLSREEARAELVSLGISDATINAVLEKSHCDPPENYFIASEDMVNKAGVWAHFGTWNFNRGLMYNTYQQPEYKGNDAAFLGFLQDRFNYTDDKAQNTLRDIRNIRNSGDANNWISPWPSYASGARQCQNINESIILCDSIRSGNQRIPVLIDLETKNATIESPQGNAAPNTVWFATEDGWEFEKYDNPIGISLVVYPDGDRYRAIAVSPEIAGGMFTRMFFLGGHGLEHFKLFSFEQTISGGRVYVYKVDWEGSDMTLLDAFTEPEVVEEVIEDNETVADIVEEPELNTTIINSSDDLASNES